MTLSIFEKTSAEPSTASRANWIVASILTVVAAVVPAAMWIGDMSWMQDEPRLLAKAFHANANHTIEVQGLNGNFGVPYGPLPTQIYQVLLLFTHDPLKIGAVRAGLCGLGTAVGLLLLGRALKFSPWFALALCLAPYVWNFNRLMWDASFAIPLGAIALGAYATFLRSRSRVSLLTTVASTVGLMFIHPQDLPLLAPIGLHLLWRHRGAVAKNYIGIAVVLGIFLALNCAYFKKVYEAFAWQFSQHNMRTSYPIKTPLGQAVVNPLLSGEMLGAFRFTEQDSQLKGPPRQVILAAEYAAGLCYVLVWAGIGVAMIRILRHRRTKLPREYDVRSPAEIELDDARLVMYGIGIAGLALQILLYGALRMPALPQYFFGTYALHAMLAWFAIDWLSRYRLGLPATLIYGIGGGYLTIASMIYIHHVGYERNTYRPSLANQVEIVKQLNEYDNPTVVTDVVLFKSHPQSIRTLRLLMAPEAGKATKKSDGKLFLTHRSGPTGTDSGVVLTELPIGAITAADAEALDVSPLPPNWVPAKW